MKCIGFVDHKTHSLPCILSETLRFPSCILVIQYVCFLRDFYCVSVRVTSSKGRVSVSTGEVDTAILAKCNPCMSNPCLNHGSCEADQTDGYRCQCSEGFKVSTKNT